MNNLIVAAALALAFTWLIGKFFNRADPETKSRMHKIDGVRARALKKSGALFVDVVTPSEFSAAHIPGAINIPVSQLAERLSELGESQEVVVYCRSGMRSKRAAQMIAKSGRIAYDLGPMGAY